MLLVHGVVDQKQIKFWNLNYFFFHYTYSWYVAELKLKKKEY